MVNDSQDPNGEDNQCNNSQHDCGNEATNFYLSLKDDLKVKLQDCILHYSSLPRHILLLKGSFQSKI